MAEPLSELDRRWAERQLDTYQQRLPTYAWYAAGLERVLLTASGALAPHAIVQTRAKSIASFGDKIWRKRAACDNPVDEFTDLCGARVITQTAAEIDAVSDWIEDHFRIDWENTVDKRQRLKPTEFGYRSVHYIVTLEPDRFTPNAAPVESDTNNATGTETVVDVPNRRAEIQVRTLLEHAWASASHELMYKSSRPIPAKLQRELTAVAALLESADSAFARVKADLRTYAADYSADASEPEVRREIEILRLVLARDAGNAQVGGQVGRLANLLEDWSLTEKELAVLSSSGNLAVLHALGRAMCGNHRPDSAKHEEGRKLLARACELPNRDPDILISYGDTCTSAAAAGEWYRRAFELDPSHPRAVARHLEHEIVELRNPSVMRTMVPVVDGAIRRCRNQAAVEPRHPEVFYEIGRFCLLRGDPSGSLAGYCKALQLTKNPSTIRAALDSLQRLEVPGIELSGFDWVTRLLLAGLGSRHFVPDIRSSDVDTALTDVRQLSSQETGLGRIQAPVLILAGGCSSQVEAQMQSYRDIVLEAFKYFEGTIVSGGTTAGVGRLAGDLRSHYGDRIRTVAYVPRTIPEDIVVDRDLSRYDEIRTTDGERFSPLQPIQNWIDFIASGLNPAEVKLLGMNGGLVAGAEYRIALAMGATVGLIAGSGRATAQLFDDQDWSSAERLVSLPPEQHTLRAFIESEPAAAKFDAVRRDLIGRAIHRRFRFDQQDRKPPDDPAMTDWNDLEITLQQSNRAQADHLLTKLERLGYGVAEVGRATETIGGFPPDHIELMAEWEHRRWNLERLLAGWTWAAERNLRSKRSPYLVAWPELADALKEYDRDAVRAIPQHLAAAGLSITPPGDV